MSPVFGKILRMPHTTTVSRATHNAVMSKNPPSPAPAQKLADHIAHLRAVHDGRRRHWSRSAPRMENHRDSR